MSPLFPEVGPRGGRYRIARGQCRACGTWYDRRYYPAVNHPSGVSNGECRSCATARVCAIKLHHRKARPGYKCCRGCGAKHTVENSGHYCAACLTAWRCRDCGRGDRPRDAHDRCATCARREYRHLSAHCARVAIEAELWTPATARDAVVALRRYPGPGRPSRLTFPVLARTARAPVTNRRR